MPSRAMTWQPGREPPRAEVMRATWANRIIAPGENGGKSARAFRITALPKRSQGGSILARLLKDRGIVTERQLQEAIHHQVLYGGRLGTSLYELGMISEEKLQEILAKAHGVTGP